MNRHASIRVSRGWLVVLALSIATPSLAGEAPQQRSQAQRKDEELGEVLVEGRRVGEKRPSFTLYQSTFDWLARLAGVFVIDGTVDVHAQGRSEDLRKVAGRAECVGFGAAPGVQCELKVRWPASTGPDGAAIPAGVSNLNPSAVLFGLEPVKSGISSILLDSRGVAETAVGEMLNANTMQSTDRTFKPPALPQLTDMFA